MKNTLKGLTLEITKSKINVTDKTGSVIYKDSFLLTDTNHMEMLRDAKCWLWNMGNFNGEASEFIQKHNIYWVRELNKQ